MTGKATGGRSDPDYHAIEVLSSLALLNLLEKGGILTSQQRRESVVAWRNAHEQLPRGWTSEYETLFGEPVPR
jgi:hypothetical protein